MLGTQEITTEQLAITPILPMELKSICWVRLGYVPTALAAPFHCSYAHERYIFGGWRGGKSFTSAMEVAPYLLFFQDHNRPDDLKGVMWLIGPDYRQARAEFNYLLWAARKLGILDGKPSTPQDGPRSFKTTTGWLVETKSSRHIEGLGSITVNVILVCEAGQHEPDIRTWALGRVSETHGPIIYSGTLERSQEWYAEIYDTHHTREENFELRCFSLPSWNNPKYEGEQDPRLQLIRKTISLSEWLVRFCGKKSKPREIVFPEFMIRPELVHEENEDGKFELVSKGHICHVHESVDYVENEKVFLFVDPGEVYTVLAGQFHILMQSRMDDPENKLIGVPALFLWDEIYLEHGHFDQVRQILLAKPWISKVEASYHDRATRQHHNQKSQEELWRQPVRDGGLGMSVLYNKEGLGILDGINMLHRWLLCRLTGQPLIYYNPRCRNAIAEYGKEKYPKSRTSRSTMLPLDKHNHARKAVCYGLYHRYGLRLPFEDALLAQAQKPDPKWNRYGF